MRHQNENDCYNPRPFLHENWVITCRKYISWKCHWVSSSNHKKTRASQRGAAYPCTLKCTKDVRCQSFAVPNKAVFYDIVVETSPL